GITLYKKFNVVAKNVAIKIPIDSARSDSEMHFDGLKAIKKLSSMKIPVNCTLIFTPEQALLAARAGASMVSPFAGRVDDYLREREHVLFEKQDYYPSEGVKQGGRVIDDNGIISGVDLVAEIVSIFEAHGIETEVLAASIRNARQLREV